MPPSGPPPAKATPIFVACEFGALPPGTTRRTPPSRMFLLTRLLAKAPGPNRSRGFSAFSQVYWNQRFDVALVARFTRLPTLRAAFVVDLRASFAWRCAGAFAASGKNFGSD